MEAQIEKQLEKIMPEDLARTFESAYHVLQGRHEHMDDLLKNGGTLLRKAAQRFSSTQLILGIAGIATVAVILINRAQDDDHDEAQDMTPASRSRLSQSKQSKPKDQEND